ncbi:Dif1p SCDLUD_004323 [Saccharomycodes ludwigii]|uniref:Dif1p n=1 Tax=Saccharomycodes ludwigii TaxID=36035 RepID=UPI001E875571|nr:hypothetical protein SCDLUD_004323 [Saccharomycodes ludwigii]KAH3900006.1 hypothetical protein SCDLUD_004323 [Saccharomycodes ludwigii]
MSFDNQGPAKRRLRVSIQQQHQNQQSYEYQDRLSTVGMRIRQAIDTGYKIPPPVQQQQQQQQQQPHSNNIVQDNSIYTIPDYKRVPLLNKEPPMLVNQQSSSDSTLELWENNLEQRLYTLDNTLNTDSEFNRAVKRGFDDISF